MSTIVIKAEEATYVRKENLCVFGAKIQYFRCLVFYNYVRQNKASLTCSDICLDSSRTFCTVLEGLWQLHSSDLGIPGFLTFRGYSCSLLSLGLLSAGASSTRAPHSEARFSSQATAVTQLPWEACSWRTKLGPSLLSRSLKLFQVSTKSIKQITTLGEAAKRKMQCQSSFCLRS